MFYKPIISKLLPTSKHEATIKMKNTLTELFNNIPLASILLFCSVANADHITISTANNYPYKNLINRTDNINISYITNDENTRCKVEILLGKIKWISTENIINKEFFNDNILSNCLSRETAEQILFQTYIQFGRGL